MDPETCYACGYVSRSRSGRHLFVYRNGEPLCDGCASTAAGADDPWPLTERKPTVIDTERVEATFMNETLPTIGYRLTFTIGVCEFVQDIHALSWYGAMDLATNTMDIVTDYQHTLTGAGPDNVTLTRI